MFGQSHCILRCSVRVLDGIAVCAVMTVAQATAYALHLGLQTSSVPILVKRIAEFTDNGSMLLYILRPTLACCSGSLSVPLL